MFGSRIGDQNKRREEDSAGVQACTSMITVKDAAHLIRLAAAFTAGLVVFLALRGLFVPKSFGEFGHYRGVALGEIAAQPVSYAGHEVCEGCHDGILQVKRVGRHARVACETCHGPQARHTEDPGNIVPLKLDTAVLCPRCHEASYSKPMDFPQVHAAEHSSDIPCDTCHEPHSPRIEAKGKK